MYQFWAPGFFAFYQQEMQMSPLIVPEVLYLCCRSISLGNQEQFLCSCFILFSYGYFLVIYFGIFKWQEEFST